MSWLYSQALVEESSAERCLDGAQCALWNAMPTQRPSWLPAKTTDACRLSRSGMTYAPLTDDLGEALLTWCLADSLASIFPALARAPGLPESTQDSGRKWPESLARFDHDSRSWKTHQCSLFGGLESFSETWPRWGMMRDGECWGLPTLEHNTSENESGFLPTPLESDGEGGGVCRSKNGREYNLRDWWANQGLGKRRQQRKPEFWEWVMGWPMGWTASEPLATDRFRQWSGSHGIR